MTKVILTYDPLDGKFMSIANLINRSKQHYPFDHIAMVKDGIVYESTFRVGVHTIDFEEWKKDRQGTFLLIYTVPDDFIDFDLLENYIGKPYDLRAIVNILRNRFDKLKKNANDRIFCSELYAIGRRHDEPYYWSPGRCEIELSGFLGLDGFDLRTELIPPEEPSILLGQVRP